MMYVLLLVGFVLLIKGADLFVDGSSSIASKLKVPSVVIGLTIVAMGTSAPEAAVSITAGLAGNSDISLSNILGSNIFNLLVVIGICAIIYPVATHKEILRRDLIWNIGCSILLLITLLDSKMTLIEGILLLLCLVIYLVLIVRSAVKNREEDETLVKMSLSKSIIFLVIGLGAVILGGNLVVNNASLIAAHFGMSDTLIGLTIVAIGTSLPELVTSIVASKKGNSGIALGNAVGSSIFNILFILGISSSLSTILVASELFVDAILLIVVSVLIYIFAGTQNKTNRIEGVFCVLCYIAYSVYIILR